LRRFAHAKMCSELRRDSIKQQIQCRSTCCDLYTETFCAIWQRQVKYTKNHQLTPTWLEQPSDLESDALTFCHGVDAQRFVSDEFLNWKYGKIIAKPIKRIMKNIWRPLYLKSYLFNCSSQLSSSWLRRIANVPQVEEEIVVFIRVVRFTHNRRKWSNWWEKRIPDLEEFWICKNVFRIETRQHQATDSMLQ